MTKRLARHARLSLRTPSSVGAGLPAIQAPRCIRSSKAMLSQASRRPHKADSAQGVLDRGQHQMHVTLEDFKHLVSGERLWPAKQALIFHPTDYRRQHFGILL